MFAVSVNVMRPYSDVAAFAGLALALAFAVTACNTSGLSEAPRATFAQLSCLDVNQDDVINAADAADPSALPDFNADRSRDADDAAFLYGLEIRLDPNRDRATCEDDDEEQPEYLVAHGYFTPSDVSCDDPGDDAVLVLGVGGGVENLRDKGDASGVRAIVDALLEAYDERDVQTIGVISGQAAVGAINAHDAMQGWLAHAVRVYVNRYPCLRVVLVGHSHGGVTVEAVAATLEPDLADRIIVVVDVDRIEDLYVGGMARPSRVPVFNIYETNDPAFATAPYEAPNVENWDASAERHDGEPVIHTSIDNAKPVRERIVTEVLERS